MDILRTAIHALWQVLLVGLLLGVGLPALFGLGIRTLHNGRRAVPVDAGSDRGSGRPTAAALGAASVCFGLCILAVLFGIVVIVYGKQMFGV